MKTLPALLCLYSQLYFAVVIGASFQTNIEEVPTCLNYILNTATTATWSNIPEITKQNRRKQKARNKVSIDEEFFEEYITNIILIYTNKKST